MNPSAADSSSIAKGTRTRDASATEATWNAAASPVTRF